jgi:glycine/D-amino acid oxidase-like deaminating enzyme
VPDRSRKHVAVLGAGLQGCCIALELAGRGHRVELFDRCDRPLTQASYWNEGKIHLGLVYANDPAGRTYVRMLEGALQFETLLRRWLGGPVPGVSTPFYYAVHRTSLLDPPRIAAHFAAVEERYRTQRTSGTSGYFGAGDGSLAEPLSRTELSGLFDTAQVQAAFRTVERAVNVRLVADALRSTIEATGQITFRGRSDIVSVRAKDGNGYLVQGTAAGTAFAETYADVVNSLWGGRLAVDRTNGLTTDRPWLYRTKLGIILRARPGAMEVPSTTFVLGSYGDTVNYDNGSIYLSWYPICLVGLSSDIEPPDYVGTLDGERRRELAMRSIAAMSDLVPALMPYRDGACIDQVGGGIIFAWGAADIDDPVSELHRRYDIGVHSYGRYHSIDTGKYTMAPYFAIEACNRIEGLG